MSKNDIISLNDDLYSLVGASMAAKKPKVEGDAAMGSEFVTEQKSLTAPLVDTKPIQWLFSVVT